MHRLFLLGTAIVVSLLVETSLGCSNCHNKHHHYGRKKRSVSEFQNNLKEVQTVFKDIEVELRAAIAPKLSTMSDKENAQFENDVTKFEAAAEGAYLSIIADNDGKIGGKKEVMKTILARLTAEYSGEPWFQRMSQIGGSAGRNIIKDRMNALR